MTVSIGGISSLKWMRYIYTPITMYSYKTAREVQSLKPVHFNFFWKFKPSKMAVHTRRHDQDTHWSWNYDSFVLSYIYINHTWLTQTIKTIIRKLNPLFWLLMWNQTSNLSSFQCHKRTDIYWRFLPPVWYYYIWRWICQVLRLHYFLSISRLPRVWISN